ncbi:RsmB/NOP family class I SAM-dependent RNA methyltransferase [Paenibacillus sp. J5C_2022]|uniref:RsmF rRNA methyltransferase first C-terminal domain-containing protein n=1 Tax=Paenibacillus sp. J5C2022 TaxID=2977129 RepID=UPI0021CE3B90|nr:RsmB/NOP family class I SAM-dependent RNA methyltransferase [Paenibacillus sp. J5C2022]MCU6707628.1 RsmB/NOP family class I SAM-dependent RNA methyltransferase [Paenibacillus sp. J5C2022]
MIEGLPEPFLDKMKTLLKEEYADFIASYYDSRVYGLRINPLKLKPDEWQRLTSMQGEVTPIPWTSTGFYYEEEERPGKHPHYHAGLYYIQEPSAMAPAELLDVQPGHRVLDLCAAPGGKTTQLAGKLQGQGVLVANDNALERTKALAKNIELSGVRNAVILNEEPGNMVRAFKGWFDRILVDAPCSGEGMFRKNPAMSDQWEKHSVEKCSLMQRDILEHAANMLAPGGMLLYSTCTFSPEENESQLAVFLAKRPDFEVQPIPKQWGWRDGRPDWVDADLAAQLSEESLQSMKGTARLWPHHVNGEGHYLALLKRTSNTDAGDHYAEAEQPTAASEPQRPVKIDRKAGRKRRREDREQQATEVEQSPFAIWQQFAQEHLQSADELEGKLVIFGSIVYLQPEGIPDLGGLRVVRAGWLIGEVKRDRFHPSQALAMGLSCTQAARCILWSAESEEVIRYLKGETLFVDEEKIQMKSETSSKGYVLVCLDGYPLGWGKYVGGMLKNELAAGWRRI